MTGIGSNLSHRDSIVVPDPPGTPGTLGTADVPKADLPLDLSPAGTKMDMHKTDSPLSTLITPSGPAKTDNTFSIAPSMPTLSALYAPENAPEHLGELGDDLHTIVYEPDGGGGERPILDSGFTLRTWTSARALVNGGSALVLILAILMLFVGYPIFTQYYPSNTHSAGLNASGQMGTVAGVRMGLIDPDTPRDAYTRLSTDGTTMMNLVFSDEFETPGRSFYPGNEYVYSLLPFLFQRMVPGMVQKA